MSQPLARTDSQIHTAVVDELQWIPSINSDHINVAVVAGAVTLFGQVGTYPEKLWAERATKRVHGVRAVHLNISVGSSWAGVLDGDVLRESEEALLRAIDVPASVRAHVVHHEVTLSGEVQWQYQRDAAVRAVQYLKGVATVRNTILIRPQLRATGLPAAIGAALARNAQFVGSTIGVTADEGGFVTLRGFVGSWAEKRQAEHTCWAAPGVTGVDNHLRLRH